jgi:ribonuclease D
VLVTDPDEVAAIAGRIAAAPLAAFDVEFVSQDRLVPTLCVVQVAWLPEHADLDAPVETIVAYEPEVRLLDALAVDVAPVVHALAAHRLVVAHAARQDLGLFAQRFDATLPGLVDTQLMAAFAGVGDQVGLATLAAEVLGVQLAKEQQWTDWQRRPLSEAQLAYAIADVRYLHAIYARLAARLGPRVEWVREESRQVGADATAAAAVTPETAWQQIGGARGLDTAAQTALVALAAWRHRTAVDLDRPLGQVLGDKVLLELARYRPSNAGGVRAVKGMSPIAKTRADEIVRALADAKTALAEARAVIVSEADTEAAERAAAGIGGAGAERGAAGIGGAGAERAAAGTAATGAGKPPWRAASVRAQRWAEMLIAIVQLVADETGIAARLLATRADAEEVARTVDASGIAAARALPAFSTWRRAVIGEVWVGWLAGQVAIVGDAAAPHGIRLVRR